MSPVVVIALLADKLPADKDVKAGWTAFAIFIGLGIAVALLGWSLVRQLRKARQAEEAGVYDRDERRDADRTGRPTPVEPAQRP